MSIRRSTAFVLALTLSLVVVTSGAWAYTGPVLSPAEVVDIDRFLDGEVIGVEGEAVGEALRAMGGGWWVNLLGDEVGLRRQQGRHQPAEDGGAHQVAHPSHRRRPLPSRLAHEPNLSAHATAGQHRPHRRAARRVRGWTTP